MNHFSTEKIEFRKIRNFSEHINASASFIRQNIVPMIKILVQVSGVYIVLGLIMMMVGFYFGFVDILNFDAANPNLDGVNFGLMGGAIGIGGILFLIANVLYTATTYRYILEYALRDDYNQLSETDVKRYLGRDSKIVFFTYLGLFGLGILTLFIAIIPILGALAFFFGWIYLIVPVSLIFLLRIHEKIGFMDAIKRCLFLAKGYWWQTFGLYLLAGLIMYSISAVPSLFSNFGFMIGDMLSSETMGNLLFGVFYIISIVVSIVTSVAFSVIIAFRYFSLVEIKEGHNMMDRIQDIGE